MLFLYEQMFCAVRWKEITFGFNNNTVRQYEIWSVVLVWRCVFYTSCLIGSFCSCVSELLLYKLFKTASILLMSKDFRSRRQEQNDLDSSLEFLQLLPVLQLLYLHHLPYAVRSLFHYVQNQIL